MFKQNGENCRLRRNKRHKCTFSHRASLWIHNKGSILSNTREHNWINVVRLHIHKPGYCH